jgi:hypothetical protein
VEPLLTAEEFAKHKAEVAEFETGAGPALQAKVRFSFTHAHAHGSCSDHAHHEGTRHTRACAAHSLGVPQTWPFLIVWRFGGWTHS